ncbi:Uncharacterised protein [Mycobacterium tuberculosis]|nr:Uncharacterised protein [Mycobacterium tuberculosis]
MVTGNHFYRNAGTVAGRHRRCRGRSWWIAHRLQAGQRQRTWYHVFVEVVGSAGAGTHPGCQHPQPPGSQHFGGTQHGGAVQRPQCAVGAHLGAAQVEHALHSTLGQHHMIRPVAMQGGHVLPLGTERYGCHLRQSCRQPLRVEAGLGGHDEHRALGGIADDLPACAVANQCGVVAAGTGQQRPAKGRIGIHRNRRVVGVAQEDVGCIARSGRPDLTVGCPDRLDRHLILGQRSGLVGADDRGAAQRFHRG